MKLNNKGFAITGILYGLLILFALLVASYLTVLTARKNRLDGIITDIEEEYNNSNITYIVQVLVEDGNGDSDIQTINKGETYTFTFSSMSQDLDVSCTNNQVAEYIVNNSYMATLTIESVTADTTCNVYFN